MNRNAAIEFLQRGKALAAEMKSADPKRRGWIGVYPLDLSRESTRKFLLSRGFTILAESGRAYHVRMFEVDRELIDADVWFGEDSLHNKKSLFAFSEENLISLVEQAGIAFEALEPHYKSDYPI